MCTLLVDMNMLTKHMLHYNKSFKEALYPVIMHVKLISSMSICPL